MSKLPFRQTAEAKIGICNALKSLMRLCRGGVRKLLRLRYWASARDKTRRLIVAYRASGAASVIHKARGRASNNRLIEGIREYAVELVRSNYADFGPSLSAEMLLSRHDLKVSRETLRRWMMAEGLWRPRKQRRNFHHPGCVVKRSES